MFDKRDIEEYIGIKIQFMSNEKIIEWNWRNEKNEIKYEFL